MYIYIYIHIYIYMHIMKIIPTWPRANLRRFHQIALKDRTWPCRNYFHNISSVSCVEYFITF